MMSTMTKATWVGKSLSQLTGHSPPSGKPEQELKANTEAGTVEEHWAHWACFLTHLRPTWFGTSHSGLDPPTSISNPEIALQTSHRDPLPRCVMLTPEISYCGHTMGVTKTSQCSVPLRTLR